MKSKYFIRASFDIYNWNALGIPRIVSLFQNLIAIYRSTISMKGCHQYMICISVSHRTVYFSYFNYQNIKFE